MEKTIYYIIVSGVFTLVSSAVFLVNEVHATTIVQSVSVHAVTGGQTVTGTNGRDGENGQDGQSGQRGQSVADLTPDTALASFAAKSVINGETVLDISVTAPAGESGQAVIETNNTAVTALAVASTTFVSVAISDEESLTSANEYAVIQSVWTNIRLILNLYVAKLF